MRRKFVVEGLGPEHFLEEAFLAMAGVGFLQSLWEKPIWEAVWPYLDSVLFTHSVHGLECAREVRAPRRALFLPDTEGASNGAGR